MSKEYRIADPERMKNYKTTDGEGYLVGLMILDACFMLLTHRDIKLLRKDVHERVDKYIDELEEKMEKDFTLKDAQT